MADNDNSAFTDVSLNEDPITLDDDGSVADNKQQDQQDNKNQGEGQEGEQEGSDPNAIDLEEAGIVQGSEGEDNKEGEKDTDENGVPKDKLEDFKESDNEQEGESDQDEEEDKDNDDEPSSSEGSDASSSEVPGLGTLTSALREKGVLEDDVLKDEEGNEKQVKDPESLLEAVEKTVEKKAEKHIKQYDENIQDILEARKQGVPLEKYKESKSREEIFSQITEDQISGDEKVQENIVRRDLLNKGYKQESVDRKIESFRNNENLEEEAKDSLEALKQDEQKEQERLKKEAEEKQKEQEEQRKQQIEQIKKSVNETKEIAPGIDLTENEKKAVIKSITEPVDYDDNGQPINRVVQKQQEDPVEFEKRLHALVEKGFFDKDPSKSKVGKQQTTKAVDKLRQDLEQGGKAPSTKKGKKGSGNSKEQGENDPKKIAEAL